jgi:hypothetical protein
VRSSSCAKTGEVVINNSTGRSGIPPTGKRHKSVFMTVLIKLQAKLVDYTLV